MSYLFVYSCFSVFSERRRLVLLYLPGAALIRIVLYPEEECLGSAGWERPQSLIGHCRALQRGADHGCGRASLFCGCCCGNGEFDLHLLQMGFSGCSVWVRSLYLTLQGFPPRPVTIPCFFMPAFPAGQKVQPLTHVIANLNFAYAAKSLLS